MTNQRRQPRWGTLLGLTILVGLSVAGCARRASEMDADQTGAPGVQVERGSGTTEVRDSAPAQSAQENRAEEARQDLDQAGQQAREGAREAGQSIAASAREAGDALDRGAKQVGQELGPAARQAGQALQEGARKVGEKVGPIAREVLSDASITARIKAKLIADPEINPFFIDVDTVNSIVTLNGEVASQAVKDEAEKLARQTEGVRQVNNVIQVKTQTPTPAAGAPPRL